MKSQNKIGEILIKRSYITRKQLNHALAEKSDKPIGEVLIEMGYVKPEEINEALTEQNLMQKAQEVLQSAVKNPIQHKVLWFIVVFAIAGIALIYNIITGTVDQNIDKNTFTNNVQSEDINANTVKQKKLRLRYIGHNAKLNEMSDTTKKIKDRASNFKKDTKYEIKRIDNDISDNLELMQEQDSSNSATIGDLEDRFFTFRSTSKNALKRLKEDNATLLDRVNKLETELNTLKNQNKEK